MSPHGESGGPTSDVPANARATTTAGVSPLVTTRVRAFGALVVGTLLWSAANTWTERHNLSRLPAATRPITIARLPREQFARRARQAMLGSVTDAVTCRRTGLADLGLVTHLEPAATFEAPTLWQHLGPEAATAMATSNALYLTGRDSILVVDGATDGLSHEYVHALDDQYTDRMARAATGTTDQAIATRIASEGAAVLLSGGHVVRLSPGTSLDALAWAAAYQLGPALLARAFGRDTSAVLGYQPRTAREVLTLGTGRQASTATVLSAPPLAPGEQIACSDQVGSLGLAVALTGSRMDVADLPRIAQTWAGDRLDVIVRGTSRRVVWQVLVSDSATLATLRQGSWAQVHLTARGTSVLTGMSTDELPLSRVSVPTLPGPAGE